MISAPLVDVEAIAFLRVSASDETAVRVVRVDMAEETKGVHLLTQLVHKGRRDRAPLNCERPNSSLSTCKGSEVLDYLESRGSEEARLPPRSIDGDGASMDVRRDVFLYDG